MAAPQSATETSMPTDRKAANQDPVALSSNGKGSSKYEVTREEKEGFQSFMLDKAVTRDWYHYAALQDAQNRTAKTLKIQHAKIQDYKIVQSNQHVFDRNRVYGGGYNGFGNGHTDTMGESRIVYPREKPRLGKRTTSPLKWSRKDLREQSEHPEELVPIRIEVDWDKIRLRDTFTWNLHDRIVTVEVFAAQFIEDMGIKPPAAQPVFDLVVHQIKEQLNDYHPFAYSAEDALDPELPYSAYKNDDMRILIKLNITIGVHTLVDQFEWDINNEQNDPEKFAEVMARELSLSGEFKTAIAHCIREQSHLFAKSLYTVGHPFDGRPVEDPDLMQAMMPSPLHSVFRPQQQSKEYGPFLYELSEADLDRNEVTFSREQRLKKRSLNRRGGPALPDLKDRQRTIRTLFVSSVLPGAARNIDDTRLYKRSAAAMRRARAARDGEISDSEDSDDSMAESPAMTGQPHGNVRMRAMRVSGTAAPSRMVHLGRSETPEISITHHHETRISRRGHGRDWDEPEDPQSLWITLRVSKDKLRRLFRDGRGRRALSRSETPASQTAGRPSTASGHGAMRPPATLGPTTPTTSAASGAAAAAAAAVSSAAHPPPIHNIGRLPAPPPPPPGHPAPVPVSACLPSSSS